MPYDVNGNWVNDEDKTLDTQQALNQSLGFGLKPVYLKAGESDLTNTFFAIQIVTDTELTGIVVANSEGQANLVGIGLSAGLTLYGELSEIEVASGVVACYK